MKNKMEFKIIVPKVRSPNITQMPYLFIMVLFFRSESASRGKDGPAGKTSTARARSMSRSTSGKVSKASCTQSSVKSRSESQTTPRYVKVQKQTFKSTNYKNCKYGNLIFLDKNDICIVFKLFLQLFWEVTQCVTWW